MNRARQCQRCGAPLAGQAVDELCGNCLLKLALEPMVTDTSCDVTKAVAVSDGAGIDVPVAEVAGATIDRYKLREKLGEGGFGEVYVAEQEEPIRRRVALKVIKLGMDTQQVIARFEAERQALAMMDHPNIARVLDAGTTAAGRPYFVMELVRGIRITDYCDQNQLSTKERLGLFIRICHAIQHAHQKGIIHRDIKPSNVLVTLHDGVPVPKVIDFGIAKAIEGRLTNATVYTQLHQFMGTPAYMSPEQAEMSGLDIDTRSDIYALGVLLYQLLTSKTPFDGTELLQLGIDEMRRTIREKEPMRPSTRLATLQGAELTTTAKRRSVEMPELIHLLKGDLDWVVMKCLEKDRTRRYETATGLAADLKRHLDNEPVIARPPSTAYKLQKAFHRHKLTFTAAGAVVAALITGLAFSTWQMFEARKAQRETEVARKGEHQQRLEAESAQKVAETQQRRADAQARKAAESQEHSRRLLYAADMNLAHQALKVDNLGKARQLLDRHRPQPGEEDLRGWEWRYLWQLSRGSGLVTLTNRAIRGWSVSFSPDGSRLAAGWEDGQVELWDIPGRRLTRVLMDRAVSHQGHVAFAPVRNLLAATSEPKVVTLYDLDAGREAILWRAPDQGQWDVRDLAFSQDGSKVVIYAGATGNNPAVPPEHGDAVWVVNVSSFKIENHHPTAYSHHALCGAAQLSPDNRRLYLANSDARKNRYGIQCIDLVAGRELWQTEPERDHGLTTLATSPDGRVVASASGFGDPTIRVWDAATGRLLVRLEGHTAWVGKLTFTPDGRRLLSASSDQSIRFWDTSNWTESQVLRGHPSSIGAVAISEAAQLVGSSSKAGDLMLWKVGEKPATEAYTALAENLVGNWVLPLDGSRALLLPPGKPPELVDFKRSTPPRSLPEMGPSTNVLGCYSTNILCHWNGNNQILVHELRGEEFIRLGAISMHSNVRPFGFDYNPSHQLMTWTEGISSTSVFLARLLAPDRRTELTSDAAGLATLRLSEDGKHLGAATKFGLLGRVWNLDSGQEVSSQRQIPGLIHDATFAAGGRVLAVAVARGSDHEVVFYDLLHPDREPRIVPGRNAAPKLAVSRDGQLMASSSSGGQARLFDSGKGELIGSPLHAHVTAVSFSPDGRRLLSASGAPEAVKLWDVNTQLELITLSGAGSFLRGAKWTADGNVILAGTPWQVWRAPSWEEIAAAEGADGRKEEKNRE